MLSLALLFACIRVHAVEPTILAVVVGAGVSVGLWGIDKVINCVTYDPVYKELTHLQKEREALFIEQQKKEVTRYEELLQAERAYLVCKSQAEALESNDFVGRTRVPLACKNLALLYASLSDLDTQEKIFKTRE